MNVYDEAHNLARAIRQSDAFVRVKTAQKKLEQDEKAWEMVADFKKKQLEVQQAALMGMEVPEDKAEAVNNLMAVLVHNPLIAEYFAAESSFIQMIIDIRDILQKAMEADV